MLAACTRTSFSTSNASVDSVLLTAGDRRLPGLFDFWTLVRCLRPTKINAMLFNLGRDLTLFSEVPFPPVSGFRFYVLNLRISLNLKTSEVFRDI